MSQPWIGCSPSCAASGTKNEEEGKHDKNINKFIGTLEFPVTRKTTVKAFCQILFYLSIIYTICFESVLTKLWVVLFCVILSEVYILLVVPIFVVQKWKYGNCRIFLPHLLPWVESYTEYITPDPVFCLIGHYDNILIKPEPVSHHFQHYNDK